MKKIQRLKKLKKSMREKKRYFLISYDDFNLKEEVENSILDFSGVLGFSKICPIWIILDKNNAILSLNLEGVELVKASLCLNKNDIKVLGISGTLKGLKKYIKRGNLIKRDYPKV